MSMSMPAGATTELSQGAAALECRNITKLFGGVQALADVSLTLRVREILCLVGDNGAGKSTLTKVLTGQLQPELGQILINGTEEVGLTPRRALERGISVVPQTLALCENLNATQNVMLGNEAVALEVGPISLHRFASKSIRGLDPTARRGGARSSQLAGAGANAIQRPAAGDADPSRDGPRGARRSSSMSRPPPLEFGGPRGDAGLDSKGGRPAMWPSW